MKSSLLRPVAAALAAACVSLAMACEPPTATFDTTKVEPSVGTGTAASCTEEALRRALASTSVITFDCGAAPVSIAIERTLVVPADRDTVIDGANRVTLDGRGSSRVMRLSQPGYRSNSHGLTLQRIRLVNGRAEGTGFVAPDPVRPRCASGFAGGNGGAIEVRNARLDVVEVVFEGNAAASPGPDVGGGAIYAAGSLGVNIVSSRFVGNSGSNGGAVGLLQSDGHIADSHFESNAATGRGRNDAFPDVSGCPGVGHPGQGGSGGNGGAVVVDGSDDGDLVVCGSVFVANRANELAGALFRTANGPARRVAIEESVFTDNEAAQGGALFLMNTSPLEVTASSFTGNVAQIAGAAHLVQARLVFNETRLSANRATAGVGGALLLTAADPASRLRDVSFTANESAVGGGLFAGAVFGADTLQIESTVRCDTGGAPQAALPSRPVTPALSGECAAQPIQKSQGNRER